MIMQKILKKFNINTRSSLLIPYFIYSVIFIITPLIFIAVLAFTPVFEDGQRFNNFGTIQQGRFWIIMLRSVYLGVLAAVFSLFIAMPFVYIVARSQNKIFKTIAMSLILSPFFIFSLVKVLAIRGLFSAMFDVNSLNNDAFLLLGLIYLYLPFMIIPIYSIFRDMPKNILNASTDLGFSGIKTFFKVVIPYSIKAILSGVGIVFLLAATSIAVSEKLLPVPGQNQLVGNEINNLANPANPFDIALASNVVLVTLIVMSIIYFLIYLLPILIMKWKGMKNV
ncbi:spermidine/putrescine ABC transporter permease protein [Mycoplasma mobile 163K]|uniref:Spermidine/putrescine ABC transporter permease protein n=2 Tax=[Mycoplasma] mobile TaxID=2118 RepID=Q6KIP1_MYCM1|nr:spermidine/putrescine ABC transporter permease protein [Mycoplasma mobile 163K]